MERMIRSNQEIETPIEGTLVRVNDFIELPGGLVINKKQIVFIGPNVDKNKSLSIDTASWVMVLAGGIQFGLSDNMYAQIYKDLTGKEA